MNDIATTDKTRQLDIQNDQKRKLELQKQKLKLAQAKRDAARLKASDMKAQADTNVSQEKKKLYDLECALRKALGLSP